ncbi:MAG TPA: disulfide bond formation protein B [Alphaproteobacteria bacterium]|jgi:disulfide bond formation protein DsbB|nr:disulfide bond formation protein B [Alphaproteobacteria bacterium]
MTYALPDPAQTPGTIFTAFMLASIAALAGVFVFQFGFGLIPCELCLWQRLPHALAILVAGVGLSQTRAAGRMLYPDKAMPWRMLTALAAVLALLHLAGAGTAAFHVGVEQHWWAGTEACTGAAPSGLSVEDLRARLLVTPPARCDQIAWSLFGITLAGLNLMLEIVLSAAAAWAASRFQAVARKARP